MVLQSGGVKSRISGSEVYNGALKLVKVAGRAWANLTVLCAIGDNTRVSTAGKMQQSDSFAMPMY
jgi:hypothetical protein